MFVVLPKSLKETEERKCGNRIAPNRPTRGLQVPATAHRLETGEPLVSENHNHSCEQVDGIRLPHCLCIGLDIYTSILQKDGKRSGVTSALDFPVTDQLITFLH